MSIPIWVDMNSIVISLTNLISLILGGIAIILVYRLSRRDKIPFLNYYLLFLICGILTGFCDWIIFNWVYMLVPDISAQTADFIYHIFWDLIGFPAYLFTLYYLVKSINVLMKIRIKNIFYKIFRSFLIIVIVLDYIGFYFRIKQTSYFFSKPLWLIYTLIVPFVFILFLTYSYFKARRNKGNPKSVNLFILIQLVCFLIWTTFSLLPFDIGEGRHMIILVFYLGLLLPAIYLYSRQKHFMIRPGKNTGNNLEAILKEYGFTNREIELVLLLMEGKSNQEISEEMFISLQTVKNYISNMYARVGVKNRVQFVNFFRVSPVQ